MALLPILSYPHPLLKQKASPIDKVDPEMRRLMEDMLETMRDGDQGIGLAANQVGVLKRIIVIDIGPEYNEKPLLIANPEITWFSSEQDTLKEYCLSVPEEGADVLRPQAIKVRYLDENNHLQEMSAEGLLAKCFQHEIDHLDGILFPDRVSPLKRKILYDRVLKTNKRLGRKG